MINYQFGEDFIAKLKKKNVKPDLFEFDWFNNIIMQKNEISHSMSPLDHFVREFKSIWSHIKVFHACRVKDISDYYTNGIVSSSIENLDKLVLTILQPFVSKNILENLIRIMHSHYNENDEKVFVAIDKYHLQLFCGHHLEYGSEYLLSSIMMLENFGVSVKPILDSIKKSTETIPTIFECDVPFKNISSDNFLELNHILLTEGSKMLLFDDYYPPSRRTGFGIASIIRPSWIKNHTHPSISTNMTHIPPIWIDTFLTK
jgi:hypothetical protein